MYCKAGASHPNDEKSKNIVRSDAKVRQRKIENRLTKIPPACQVALSGKVR